MFTHSEYKVSCAIQILKLCPEYIKSPLKQLGTQNLDKIEASEFIYMNYAETYNKRLFNRLNAKVDDY